jgi:Uma2 family endonuclease
MATTTRTLRMMPEDPLYPSEDGKPMGETGIHVRVMLYLYAALRRRYAGQNVYVAADMFLYYRQGDPRASKAPDVMVVKGVETHERKSFKLWQEAAGPQVIFEITSPKTVEEDLGPKMEAYQELGVQEYFLFDPEGAELDPPLLGYRLKQGVYAPLKPDREGMLACKELGLLLAADGDTLRLVDAATGERVLTDAEWAAQEKQRADALAEENARLQAELAKLKMSKKK